MRYVKTKLENLLPVQYHDRVSYAIAIEETDAWLIPLYDNACRRDTAKYVNPKAELHTLIGAMKKKSKYIDTEHKNLNYVIMGKELMKNLSDARKKNVSLNLFCLEVEEKISDDK